jgi:16S rRNA (adenine1518-N6/adenine1519-N6)-dimethyltransferase
MFALQQFTESRSSEELIPVRPSPPRFRKRFGQHFLESPWVEKLLAAIEPQSNQTFLEIGPGAGALTVPLAARAKQVVAIEIDRDLVAGLIAARVPRLTVIEGDVLEVSAGQLRQALERDAGLNTVFRVAANLPYNVASPILFRLRDLRASWIPIVDATVMVQREVADRLAAEPGSKEYGVLTVLIRQHATVERVLNLPPGAFRPVPKVRSSVVRLRYHAPDPAPRDQGQFEAFIHAVFSQRRKMLRSSLAAFGERAGTSAREALDAAGIDGGRRPESLTLQELGRLADMFV